MSQAWEEGKKLHLSPSFSIYYSLSIDRFDRAKPTESQNTFTNFRLLSLENYGAIF